MFPHSGAGPVSDTFVNVAVLEDISNQMTAVTCLNVSEE